MPRDTTDEETGQKEQQVTQERKPGPIRRFLDLPPDSTVKTVTVAVALCLVASMVVSAAAVTLRPIQEVNQRLDRQVNILQVAGLYEPGIDVAEAFTQVEARVLDIEAGTFTDEFDAATFDERQAEQDPIYSLSLAGNDPAGIGRRSNFVTAYLVRDAAGAIDKVVLPIHGYGLWSTLYGFIALEEDGDEIFGLQFYQHAETPGLGAEVDNPRWRALWKGKELYAEDGDLAITVAKSVPPEGPEHHIDALAGATLTSRGVDNLVRFWMGARGYEDFLINLRTGALR